MTIGDRIKRRREELNMSVDQLASKLGKNRATIYRYEKDEIENLPTTVLEPLASALFTTPAFLMGWDNTDEQTIDIGGKEVSTLWVDTMVEFIKQAESRGIGAEKAKEMISKSKIWDLLALLEK